MQHRLLASVHMLSRCWTVLKSAKEVSCLQCSQYTLVYCKVAPSVDKQYLLYNGILYACYVNSGLVDLLLSHSTAKYFCSVCSLDVFPFLR